MTYPTFANLTLTNLISINLILINPTPTNLAYPPTNFFDMVIRVFFLTGNLIFLIIKFYSIGNGFFILAKT